MPTDDDKAAAWVRFEGEVRRLLVRRPRLDRDGLFLFGKRFGAETLTLSADELRALLEGRTAVADVAGQYLLYVSLDDAVMDEVAPVAGSATSSDEQPLFSKKVRIRAAQVRVAADRRRRVKTPKWIIELAGLQIDD